MAGKDEKYYLHQTPIELAKVLIDTIPLNPGDSVLEPFKGEGSFYDNLPDFVVKHWTEIEDGRDYKTWTTPVDWVITNPPFKLGDRAKGENAFWVLLKHYKICSVKAWRGRYFFMTFTKTPNPHVGFIVGNW